MDHNYENLPFRMYTIKSECDKALNTLFGLLSGMGYDNVYRDIELDELNNWCLFHYQLLNRNPFKDFSILINQAINNPSIRNATIDDLKWMCQKFEKENQFYSTVTSSLQELQGICHGIISDGVIKDEEVLELDKWIEDHSYLQSFYPYDEIACLLTMILADKKIDDEEKKILLAYFSEFCNILTPEIKNKIKIDTSNIRISAICSMEPNVSFDGKGFCFTGVASKAPRSELIRVIQEQGGIYTDSVSKKTDYLIVGDNGNPCWAFACYGRKVERAIELRKQGHPITIVHEYSFWDFV